MHGCHAEMHLRNGTFVADGDSTPPPHDTEQAQGHHHGLCSHGQCHALWHVPMHVQPHRSIGNGSCHGCAHSHALHSRYSLALDTWRQGAHRQHACTAGQLQANVCLWWQYLRRQPWAHREYTGKMSGESVVLCHGGEIVSDVMLRNIFIYQKARLFIRIAILSASYHPYDSSERKW